MRGRDRLELVVIALVVVERLAEARIQRAEQDVVIVLVVRRMNEGLVVEDQPLLLRFDVDRAPTWARMYFEVGVELAGTGAVGARTPTPGPRSSVPGRRQN